MATLMQKDVLLEGVFQALGYAHRANADEAAINELWELKQKLYSSKPEDLNFQEIILRQTRDKRNTSLITGKS